MNRPGPKCQALIPPVCSHACVQLFLALFFTVIFSNAMLRGLLLEAHLPNDVAEFWTGLYEVEEDTAGCSDQPTAGAEWGAG